MTTQNGHHGQIIKVMRGGDEEIFTESEVKNRNDADWKLTLVRDHLINVLIAIA